MHISDIFSQLAYGELSNLSMCQTTPGEIDIESQPQILIAINEGLLRLYTRFIIKTKDVMLEQVDHITSYHLLRQYAESQTGISTEPYLYIKDVVHDPFQQDVVKILEVRDQRGFGIPLNDKENIESYYTPQPNTLLVPQPVGGMPINITYQASHPHVCLPLDTEAGSIIELPNTLHSALRAYVGYQVYTNMGTAESTAKAMEHHTKYEALCQETTFGDWVNTSVVTTNTRFHNRGWI